MRPHVAAPWTLLAGLLLALCAAGDLVDDGSSLGRAFASSNMEQAVNNNTLEDMQRLSRAGPGAGSLTYRASKGGFSSVDVTFYFDQAQPVWFLDVRAGDRSLYLLEGATVSAAPNPVRCPLAHALSDITRTFLARWAVAPRAGAGGVAELGASRCSSLTVRAFAPPQPCTRATALQFSALCMPHPPRSLRSTPLQLPASRLSPLLFSGQRQRRRGVPPVRVAHPRRAPPGRGLAQRHSAPGPASRRPELQRHRNAHALGRRAAELLGDSGRPSRAAGIRNGAAVRGARRVRARTARRWPVPRGACGVPCAR